MALTHLQPSLAEIYVGEMSCPREDNYHLRIQQNSITLKLNQVLALGGGLPYEIDRDVRSLP